MSPPQDRSSSWKSSNFSTTNPRSALRKPISCITNSLSPPVARRKTSWPSSIGRSTLISTNAFSSGAASGSTRGDFDGDYYADRDFPVAVRRLAEHHGHACHLCFKVKPTDEFSKIQVSSNKSKHHPSVSRPSRFCIDCGTATDRYTHGMRVFPIPIKVKRQWRYEASPESKPHRICLDCESAQPEDNIVNHQCTDCGSDVTVIGDPGPFNMPLMWCLQCEQEGPDSGLFAGCVSCGKVVCPSCGSLAKSFGE